jgi:hypothetical protein
MKRSIAMSLAVLAMLAVVLVPSASAQATGQEHRPPRLEVSTEWDVPHADGFTYFEATVRSTPPTHLYGVAVIDRQEYPFDFTATPSGFHVPPFRTSGGFELQSIDFRATPHAASFLRESWEPAAGRLAIHWSYDPRKGQIEYAYHLMSGQTLSVTPFTDKSSATLSFFSQVLERRVALAMWQSGNLPVRGGNPAH